MAWLASSAEGVSPELIDGQGRLLEVERDPDIAVPEAVEQVGQAVVIVQIAMTSRNWARLRTSSTTTEATSIGSSSTFDGSCKPRHSLSTTTNADPKVGRSS